MATAAIIIMIVTYLFFVKVRKHLASVYNECIQRDPILFSAIYSVAAGYVIWYLTVNYDRFDIFIFGYFRLDKRTFKGEKTTIQNNEIQVVQFIAYFQTKS